MTVTVSINASDSAAIRRDDEVITPFYKIGSTEAYYDEWYYRGLLYFDLSTVPSIAKVTTAKIEISLIANLGLVSGSYSAHRVGLGWIGSQVTRWKRMTSAGWTTVGGTFDSATSAFTPSLSASESYGYKTWTFNSTGIANLQGMINKTKSNYGWLFKNSENDNRAHGFDYSGNKPKLTIDFTADIRKSPVMFFT